MINCLLLLPCWTFPDANCARISPFPGQFAWGLKIEEDQVQQLAQRGARNTPEYTPTFFTAPNNHQALLRAQPAVARNAEVAVPQGPIYRRA